MASTLRRRPSASSPDSWLALSTASTSSTFSPRSRPPGPSATPPRGEPTNSPPSRVSPTPLPFRPPRIAPGVIAAPPHRGRPCHLRFLAPSPALPGPLPPEDAPFLRRCPCFVTWHLGHLGHLRCPRAPIPIPQQRLPSSV